jgi:hypothetical protein
MSLFIFYVCGGSTSSPKRALFLSRYIDLLPAFSRTPNNQLTNNYIIANLVKN